MSFLLVVLIATIPAVGQQDRVPGRELLNHPPEPKRPELPPSRAPIQFIKNERIALVGNSLAERMNLFGHFETKLHLRNRDKELIVRNFARPADEVSVRQRPSNYTRLDDPMSAFRPDTVFCFFGFNESYAGPEGLDAFRKSYTNFLTEFTQTYPRDDEGSKVRFILVSPIPFEDTADPLMPDAKTINQNLVAYTNVVKEVANQHGLLYVDLMTAAQAAFAAEPGLQYTINGCHTNEKGDQLVADLLMAHLFADYPTPQYPQAQYEKLRAAVNDKSWVHFQDYRMLNGWYVYGGRRTWDNETFPREYIKIRQMASNRDQYIAEMLEGKSVPPQPDDSNTQELIIPPTRFGDPRQKYSEPPELKYLTPEESMATMTVPSGFEVKLFADERKFPELAKPVQLSFDNKGRLWVSCMPTYPLWRPGDEKPDDRLLILEDTDKDGVADKSTVFYDKLHCPTGFEFYNGGILVTDQPRIIWLKDTDGDDKADVVVHFLDGWGTDDSHHTIGAYEFSNTGLLYMLEGVSMSTTVETPWGPKRYQGAAGGYELNPRTLELRRFTTPGYGNPWCMVFDQWGQGIVGDGTNAQQHWATALSGSQVGPRTGLDAIFDNQSMRPAVGNEFLLTRQFPDEVQGQFTYACVINMNGMPRFTVVDDGAGFSGQRIMRGTRQPNDLLSSTDKNFRPVDPQIGPDGALWFGDWCNALIGHMQYSQRDPNRDHTHGRIYRLVYKDKPLLTPVTQFGKTELELLEQFREYEPRTRYRVRSELADRPVDKVQSAVKQWLSNLKPTDPEYDRLRLEALWVLTRKFVIDKDLIDQVMTSKTFQARAAAVHVVSDLQRFIPNAIEYYEKAAIDEHPRVRAEAARALSFVPTERSARALLKVAGTPQDKWLSYIVTHSIGALEEVWAPLMEQNKLQDLDEAGKEAIDKFLRTSRPGLAAAAPLRILLNPDSQEVPRNNAYAALTQLNGNAQNGRAVFTRVCSACHKVGDRGFDFGPNLSDVGRRLTRMELIESIIEPSAKMDKKYLTEIIVTASGETFSGFISKEDDKELLMLLPEGKQRTVAKEDIEERRTAKQSSMPENLAATIAPSEFLDVIAFLRTLR